MKLYHHATTRVKLLGFLLPSKKLVEREQTVGKSEAVRLRTCPQAHSALAEKIKEKTIGCGTKYAIRGGPKYAWTTS